MKIISASCGINFAEIKEWTTNGLVLQQMKQIASEHNK